MRVFIVERDKNKADSVRNAVSKVDGEALVESFDREDELLEYLKKQVVTDRLSVRCFGYFDVFFKGRPLIFKRKQSKELLAYLIDRAGAACTSGELTMALWEDEGDEKAQMNRLRVLINDLKNTLKDIGMEDVLIRDKREIAVNRELIDCDYYKLLQGDKGMMDADDGEFMLQYSWAELTNGRLDFMKREKPEFRDTSVLYV
ncbi:MAG: winged helix-turn-helix domain-containing protein [Lachnospiraceae bacterium]|nr:winged helix-turn-helix domain-containing protein [Lachnospiraceae bacterium]